jgi:hypothetical protein
MFYIHHYLTVNGPNPAAVFETIENDEAIKYKERCENCFSFETDGLADSFLADLSAKFPDHELRVWSLGPNCIVGAGFTTVFFNGEFVEGFTDLEELNDMIANDPGFTAGDDEVDENVDRIDECS